VSDDVLRLAFEWFVTHVWERYGPVAGIFVSFSLVAMLVGAVYAVLSW